MIGTGEKEHSCESAATMSKGIVIYIFHFCLNLDADIQHTLSIALLRLVHPVFLPTVVHPSSPHSLAVTGLLTALDGAAVVGAAVVGAAGAAVVRAAEVGAAVVGAAEVGAAVVGAVGAAVVGVAVAGAAVVGRGRRGRSSRGRSGGDRLPGPGCSRPVRFPGDDSFVVPERVV